MKTTKIAPGFYTFTLNGEVVEITKTDSGEWYWTSTSEPRANDLYSSKRIAIDAAIDFIENDLKITNP